MSLERVSAGVVGLGNVKEDRSCLLTAGSVKA
jgi:hypothetical protein